MSPPRLSYRWISSVAFELTSSKRRRGCRWCQVERSVWPVSVVVLNVDAQNMVELFSARDQEPVEAVAANGPDPRSANAFAFGARNGVRMSSISSLRKTSSKARLTLLSRS